MGLFKFLKFPLWLLKLFVKKPKKKRSELEKKQQNYMRNFSVRNISWQKSLGKDKQKKKNPSKFTKKGSKKNTHSLANKKTS